MLIGDAFFCVQQNVGALSVQIFRRKPPLPFKEALQHIHKANDIIAAHVKDKRYMPSKKDLISLDEIIGVLHLSYASANYAHRCLEQRRDGEPEGAKKFNDPEVLDYHYPE
jgi:hypothetical protein